MKKLQSTTKKRFKALALVCIFALCTLMSFSPFAFAATPELSYSQVGQQVSVSTEMLEVPPGDAAIATPIPGEASTNIQPMDNPNSVAGGTFAVALSPYAAADRTLEETYSHDSAAYAFQSFLGVPNEELLNMFKTIGLENCSISDMLGLSLNQWREKSTVYAESLETAADEGKVNVFERLVNLTVEIAVSAIKTSNPESKAVFDIFDGVSATDVLSSSVTMGTLCAAASVVSNVGDSANEPIGSLLVKSADRLGPKENGEDYTDPLDLLIYQMDVQEGLKLTRNTPVREFVKLIITADGTFEKDETRTDRYASIFYINGVVDPQAVFQIPFGSFGVEAVKDSFLAEFDGKLLDSTQVSVTERTVELEGYEDIETVVTISGIFNEPGYHSMQMSLAGWPFFVYIELSPSSVPVTGVELSPTEAELKVGDLLSLNATVTPEDASNKSLSFTSDNYSVADVNQNGVVTAKAPGTATITVTTNDGEFTSVCTISVIEVSKLPKCLLKIIACLEKIPCCEKFIDCLINFLTRLFSFFYSF